MKSCEPARAAPTGAPSPFVKSIHAESKGCGERARGDAARHDGVHEAGAVHVRREAVAPPRFDDALDPLERPDAAAAEIARLLDPEQPAPRGIAAGRTHALVHGGGIELPARAVERAHVDAGQRCRPAGLEVDGMRRPVGQHLVTMPAVHAHRDLIAHGARGEKDRRLLAEELRDHLLEVVHRRVLAFLLVAHLGIAHEPAHGRRRPGHRVAVEIDIDPHGRAHGLILRRASYHLRGQPPCVSACPVVFRRRRTQTLRLEHRPWPTANTSMHSTPR